MKKAVILGMAYFSCTVGAGFASGQEMLQYYAAFGGWESSARLSHWF